MQMLTARRYAAGIPANALLLCLALTAQARTFTGENAGR